MCLEIKKYCGWLNLSFHSCEGWVTKDIVSKNLPVSLRAVVNWENGNNNCWPRLSRKKAKMMMTSVDARLIRIYGVIHTIDIADSKISIFTNIVIVILRRICNWLFDDCCLAIQSTLNSSQYSWSLRRNSFWRSFRGDH